MDEADMLLDPPPGGWGEVVTRDWLQLVLDARFAPVHEKFASIDRRFDSIDARFASLESRLTSIESEIRAQTWKLVAAMTGLSVRWWRPSSSDAVVRGHSLAVALPHYLRGMARSGSARPSIGSCSTRRGACRAWPNDASLFDAALGALLGAHRSAETDAAYRVYDERPLDEADEWGDLESFRAAPPGRPDSPARPQLANGRRLRLTSSAHATRRMTAIGTDVGASSSCDTDGPSNEHACAAFEILARWTRGGVRARTLPRFGRLALWDVHGVPDAPAGAQSTVDQVELALRIGRAIRSRTLSVRMLDMPSALRWLAELSPGDASTPSVAAWAVAFRMGLDLVARGRLHPARRPTATTLACGPARPGR